MVDKKVTIIIPNYNGKSLLAKNLPILIKYAASHEIMVVDDGSGDGSVDFLKVNYPDVIIVNLKSNHGFAYACNTGVRQANGDIVYLLNSDVAVNEDFLSAIIPYFRDTDVFAVSSFESDIGDKENKEFSIPLTMFKWGIFWYWYERLYPMPSSGVEVLCVSGGHAAFDRAKFLKLGGFDNLFRPFYAEDGDICWRAWKRGWKSLYEPRSVVSHICKGTIGRFYSPFHILTIHWKNRFLLTWKNLTYPGYMIQHIFCILPELLIVPLMGKPEFTVGFFMAILQLPELLKSRKLSRVPNPVYTDADLFKRFSILSSSRIYTPGNDK